MDKEEERAFYMFALAVRPRRAPYRGYSKDDRMLRRFAASWQPRDKTASLPQLDIVAVYDPACLLDGFLIVTVFNVFRAPSATVVSDGVDAIFGHAATPELNRAAPFKEYRRVEMRQLWVHRYPRNPPLDRTAVTRQASR